MYQNYNYYPQQQTQPPIQSPIPNYQQNFYRQSAQPQGILKGRPVSSLEEVRATSIDFDGSVFFFPDIANKRIYTKQINMDGTSSMNMYELKEIPSSIQVDQQLASSMNNFITRDEFEQVISQIKNAIIPQQPAQQVQTPAAPQSKGEVLNFQ